MTNETVTIKYVGKTPFTFNDFGKTETFIKGEIREIPQFQAWFLLSKKILVRKYKGRGKGRLVIKETLIPAFVEIKPTLPNQTQNKENK